MMVKADGHNFNNNNSGQLCCLILALAQNSPQLLLLKFLPSTYAITAISWPPPLISRLFSHWLF